MQNYLSSGFHFNENEAPLEFQFKVLNGFMAIVVLSATLFAFMGWSGLNPIGFIQSTVDFFYALSTFVLIFVLRAGRNRYRHVMHALLLFSLITCVSLLIFVTHDESRIIWYYLLVFVAYLLGGVSVGITYTVLSVVIIIGASLLIDLNFSVVAMYSNIFGLLILSMLTRLYRSKVDEYETTLSMQKKMLETFNSALEANVAQKTAELRELNNSLEIKVQEKVDEVKEQEKMLIAQSRLAAMGEMLSMIAHQWRQPLATMTLMISNAKIASMMAESPSKESKMLDEISDTLVYLSDTIDDFQTYFEPQKKSETIEISKLLERVVHFTKTRFRMNNIALFTSGKTDITIETYGSELVQILINLLNNAVDAIIETSPAVKHIMISCTERDDNLLLVVEDSGGGIPDDIISRVFEPYFSTKSKNGTGLGLYMAKMIIENHIGGHINVKNGQSGAVFTILLPKRINHNGEGKATE